MLPAEQIDEEHHDAHLTHAPVGCYPESAWGFGDMTGNVYEWCAAEQKDMYGFLPGERAIRGGSFYDMSFGAKPDSGSKAGMRSGRAHQNHGLAGLVCAPGERIRITAR